MYPVHAIALAAALAAGPTAADLATKVQNFYETTRDFTASFYQVYTSKALGRQRTSSGRVTYLRPGQIRWEYAMPEPRSYVIEGNRASMYNPKDKVLTRAVLDSESLRVAMGFLSGQGKLDRDFDASVEMCEGCRGVQLKLTPKVAQTRVVSLLLDVDAATGRVLKNTVVAPDGSTNAISFDDVKTNSGVTAAAFKVEVPKDAQVQDLKLP